MKLPNAGSLDRKITIQQSFWITKGDSGERVLGWTKFAEPWANVVESGGGEAIEAGQISDKEASTFLIRYIPGMKAAMRILYEGKFYNIRSVAQIGRRRFLLIKTETRDND